jgi:outer membrane protein OmpA-like peptidoglycan-associated protein
VVLAALLVGGALGLVALPSVVRWMLVRRVEDATGMRVRLGELSLALRRGEVRVGPLQLVHPRSGARVAGWEDLRLRLPFAPLLRRTLRVEALEVDRPFAALAADEASARGEAIPLSVIIGLSSGDKPPFALDLGRLQITQGQLRFLDAAGSGRPTQIDDLNVEFADLAPGQPGAGRQAFLRLSARWEGARVESAGSLSDPRGVELRLNEVELSRLGPFVLPPLARAAGWSMDFQHGVLNATARLSRGGAGGLEVQAKIGIREPALTLAGGRGLIGARSIEASLGRLDLGGRTLHDGRLEVRGLEAAAIELVGLSGRTESLQAAVGLLDLRRRSLQAVQAATTRFAVERSEDGAAFEGAALRLGVDGLEMKANAGRGLRLEGDGLALRGVGGNTAVARLASVGASAETVDLARRAGSGVRLEARRLAASGISDQSLSVEARSLRAAAEKVGPGARSVEEASLSLDGGAAFLPGGPFTNIPALRAAAKVFDAVAQSGQGIRLEADGVTVAGFGLQAVAAQLQAIRVSADALDLTAQAAQGASLLVEGLAAARPGEAGPFAAARALRATVSRVNLAGLLGPAPADLSAGTEAGPPPPALEVASIELEAPTLRARRDGAGIDLARLLAPRPRAAAAPQPAKHPSAAPPAAAPSAPPGGPPARAPSLPLTALAVGLAQIREGTVTLTDSTVSPPVEMGLHDLTVNLLNVRPGRDTPATLVASAKVGSEGKGSLQVGAQFTPGTLRNANGTARVDGVSVDALRAFLRLPEPIAAVTGHVTASAEARPADGAAPPPVPGGRVRPAWKIVARIEVRDLAGRDQGGTALAEASALEVKDIEVAVPDLAVTVGEVALNGFRLPIERDQRGAVRIAGIPTSALRAPAGGAVPAAGLRPAVQPAGKPAAPGSPAAGGPPSPGWVLPTVRVRHVRVAGTIPLVDRARPYPLETALSDLVLELHDVGTVGDTAMGLQLTGRLEEMTFAGAGATRFGPLQGTANLEVKSLDVVRWADYLPDPIRGRLADLRGNAQLAATFGSTLADLAIHGHVNASQLQLADEAGNGLLGVDRAEIAIGRLTLAPPALHVRSVLLDQPWVNVERQPDGRINLLDLLPSRSSASSGREGAAPGAALSGPAAAEAAAAGGLFMPVTIDRLTLRDGVFNVLDRKAAPPFEDQLKAVAVQAEGINPNGAAAPFDLAGRFSDNATLALKGKAVPRMDRPLAELQVRLDNFHLSGISTYLRQLTSHRLERGRFDLEATYRLAGRELVGHNHVRIEGLRVGEAEEWPDKFTEMVGVSLPFAVSMLEDGDGTIELDVPVRGDILNPQFDLGDAIRKAVGNAVVSVVTAPFRLIGQILSAPGRIEAIKINPVLFEPGSDAVSPAGREVLTKLVEFLEEAPGAKMEIVGYAEPDQDGKALAARGAAPQAQAGGPGVLRRLVQRLGLGAAQPPPAPEANLHGLARRRALATYEALIAAKADPERLFVGEGLVEPAAKAAERGMPPQGRAEFRIVP